MKNMKMIVGIVLIIFVVYMAVLAAGGKKPTETANMENNSAPATAQTEMKTYTAAEVAAHGDASSCWMIVNQNVYDMTNFASQHPGGERAILSSCGKDATTVFETRNGKGPHPQMAQQSLGNLQIGTLGQ